MPRASAQAWLPAVCSRESRQQSAEPRRESPAIARQPAAASRRSSQSSARKQSTAGLLGRQSELGGVADQRTVSLGHLGALRAGSAGAAVIPKRPTPTATTSTTKMIRFIMASSRSPARKIMPPRPPQSSPKRRKN